VLGNMYALKKNYSAALEQYRKAENTKAGLDKSLKEESSIRWGEKKN
jgi:hypothetical protein